MYKFTYGVVLLAALGFNLTAHARDEAQTTKANVQWTWPCTPPTKAPAPTASQQDFDFYSWQLFVALNWPAESGQRGQANCAQPIGAKGPVVWQTYKTAEQIFLPDAKNPGAWNAGEVDTSLSTINVSVLKNTGIVNMVDQAVGGWLIDQRGNPTYYAIYANKTSYDYIVNNNFYNADIVGKANNINFPDNATEIKASWRMLTKDDDASRYLTMPAQVDIFDAQGQPTGKTQAATLGLVGLHIATKATGYPQWIWSTFEQVDNVPPKENVDGKWVDKPVDGVFYSYFNSKASPGDINHSACLWQQQENQLVCVPKPGMTFSTPNPLNRVTPIAADTQKANDVAQKNLAQTVFQYYQLVTTQRPLMPDNPSNPLGQPTPAISANVTMESYIQPNSSCMNCHSMATPVNSAYRSDFSYLFKFAQTPAATTKKPATATKK